MKHYIKLNCFSLVVLVIFLMGCASSTPYNVNKAPSFLERVVKGKYEDVFQAAQVSLANYPIAVNDIEAGILKTGIITNEQMWHPPFLDKRTLFGHRYTISIQILRVKGREAVQVTIIKRMEHRKNFFEGYQEVKTNGLEEIALFYRIRRELLIQKNLNAPQKSS